MEYQGAVLPSVAEVTGSGATDDLPLEDLGRLVMGSTFTLEVV